MKRFLVFLFIFVVIGGGGYLLLGNLLGGKPNFAVGSAQSEPASAQVPEVAPVASAPAPKVKPSIEPPANPGGTGPGRFKIMSAPEAPNTTSAFEDANIAFQTPDTMKLGKAREVKLLLSLEKTVEELQSQLGSEFPTQGARIEAAPIMEANLSGSAFKISSLNPTRQAIRSSGETTWEWAVTPLEKGSHSLKLRLYVVVTLQGTSAPMEVKTFEREIPVEVSVGEVALDFAKNNVQLIWLVLVVPIAGFISRRFGKKTAAD